MIIPEKALIIRLSSIGDVLLTTPMIRVFKKKFPGCRLDFVIKKQFLDLIAAHPAVNKIYSFDKAHGQSSLRQIKNEIKAEKYDLIIDIHKNFRSLYLRTGVGAQSIATFKKYACKRWLLIKFKIDLYKHIIPVFQRYIDSLHQFRILYDGQGLDIFLPADVVQKIENQWAKRLQSENSLIIGIAPGASRTTKRWHVPGFIDVAKYVVHELGATVILFGDHQDRMITSQIETIFDNHIFNVAGELSLSETAAMMNFCDLVVTNDTGLMHLAVASKKKIVAIFGSTTEQLGFFPVSKNAVIVQNNDVHCRPCSHVGKHRCPKKHFRCMNDIQSDQVIKAINSLL